jgi:hypothetical protein
LEYTIPDSHGAGIIGSGSGRTIDLSRTGLSFTADRPLEVGLTLNIVVRWPALLECGTGTQLFLVGNVVRIDGNMTAIRIRRRHFRPCPSGSEPVSAGQTAGTLVRLLP